MNEPLVNKENNINYYLTLKHIINMSGLSIKDFATAASISESLIRHADSGWNPKYTTIEKICGVIRIDIYSFYKLADYVSGNCKNANVNYIIDCQKITPRNLNIKLKNRRKYNNLTEGKLAEKTGFDKSNISKRENSRHEVTMLCSTLQIYAQSFGITMKQLCRYVYD
jgi:transcriptional regulator with XRE-family HTH domain